MILQIILAAVATMGFSVLFNVPKKELIFCGLAGAGSWTAFAVISNFFPDAFIVATLVAAMTVTTFARFLSTLRKMPSTVYMIPGVIPLVPGTRIYFTMFHLINGDNAHALTEGIEALKIAGVLAIGLLIVLSLPRRWFAFGRR